MTRQGYNFGIGFATTPATVLFYAEAAERRKGNNRPAALPPSVCGERERKAMKGDGGRVGENERRKEKAAMRCDARPVIPSHREEGEIGK